MSNQPKAMQDPAMKQYFDTLPTSVQETIVQSGVEVILFIALSRGDKERSETKVKGSGEQKRPKE